MECRCDVCGTSFDRPNKLKIHKETKKHMINAIINKYKDYSKEKLLKELAELNYTHQNTSGELNRLKETMATISTSTAPTNIAVHENNGNVGNNIVIIENLNIVVNQHGAENWDYISGGRLAHLMKGVNSFLPEIVKLLHFNKEHPENHNIKFKNQRLNQMMVIEGNRWIVTDKNQALDSLIYSIIDKVESDDHLKTVYEQKATSHDRLRWKELKHIIGYDEPSVNRQKAKSIKKRFAKYYCN